MKRSSFSEQISFITIFGLGIFTILRGVFFSKESDSVLHDSEFYFALNNVMSIWIWGLLIAFFGAVLTLSAWLIPRQEYNNMCNYALVIGGLGSSAMYFVMLSASLYNAINWLTWAQFSVLTILCGLLGFIGGANIYARRK